MIAVAFPPTCFVAVSVRGVPVLRTAMMADNECWSVAEENGRDIGWSPQHGCFGARAGQSVPGHGETSSAEYRARGGARGWLQRAKISTTIICPPQQGQGGRISLGWSGTSSSGGGETARSSRARARLSLRAELASRP